MGEPTRVRKRGCGAGPDRGPWRESGRPRDVESDGRFRQLLGPADPVHRDGRFGFQQQLRHGNVEIDQYQYSVKGHADVFNQNVSLSLLPSVGIIGASDSAGDTLELSFAAPASGAWIGFVEGDVSFGDVAFSGASVLLGATGTVTRVGPPILPRQIIDPPPPPPHIIDLPPPPPIIGPGDPPAATAPELSTWAMMLIGLAGLGLVAKRRRALGLLGGKA